MIISPSVGDFGIVEHLDGGADEEETTATSNDALDSTSLFRHSRLEGDHMKHIRSMSPNPQSTIKDESQLQEIIKGNSLFKINPEPE